MAAIHEAVLSGNLDCVKLLVSYGAHIHQRDEEGWTPLHMACSDGFPNIARYAPATRRSGSETRWRSYHGDVMFDSPLCSGPFRYLLSLGADPELENDCGEKPADLIEPDHKELLELFGLEANN